MDKIVAEFDPTNQLKLTSLGNGIYQATDGKRLAISIVGGVS